ncbi:hypothetical protein DFH11DRAFT_1609437 [Phellopilus nigrolimitatus]|nr:hypothetical protein DFH11DRAFT_1609437 [Phellopilus nigrolimitatus]
MANDKFTNSFEIPDISTLESFVSYVTQALDEGHTIRADKLLDADGPFLSALTLDRNDVSSITKVLCKLRALDASLSTLSRIVKEGIPHVQAQLLPIVFTSGFSSLPNEVLSQIFEMAFAENKHISATLSLVCRRFREIVLHLPKLWTYLHVSKDPRLFLERSQSLGISLDIRIKNDETPAERLLRQAELHTDRWEVFMLRRDLDCDIASCDTMKHLREHFSRTTFPSLETLSVDCDCDVALDNMGHVLEGEEDADSGIRNFFSTWDTPALRKLKISNLIPSLLRANSLTCIELRLDGYSRTYELAIWNLQTIAAFLASCRSLEELKLTLQSIIYLSNETQAHVELQGIKSIHFDIQDCDCEPVEALLGALSTPNLTELSINTLKSSYETVDALLEIFFPESERRWTRLETLSLEMTQDRVQGRVQGQEFPLDIVFLRLPGLHHLSIDGHNLEQPTVFHPTYEGDGHSPLRTLRLRNCNKFDASFIGDLRYVIKSPHFKTLGISQCSGMDKAAVMEMVPMDKELEWEDYDWSAFDIQNVCASNFR